MPTPTPAPSARPAGRRLLLVVFLSAAASLAAAQSWPWSGDIKGNGQLRKVDKPLAPFTAVELALPAQMEVRVGAAESVSIETDENIHPHVEAAVRDGKLVLRQLERGKSLKPTTLKVVVTAREFRGLAIAGSGTIRGSALQSPQLKLAIGGSGNIELERVQSDAISGEIGGSGTLRLSGTAKRFAVAVAGSGDVVAQQLKVEEADVSIAGSGDVTVWPAASLKAAIAGSGDVRYYGDPVSKSSVAGSGRIRRVGASPI